MCGTYHSMMNFEVRVVGQRLQGVPRSSAIAGKTNAEALQAIDQSAGGGHTAPFDTRRGEQVPQATSRNTTCISKPGCLSS